MGQLTSSFIDYKLQGLKEYAIEVSEETFEFMNKHILPNKRFISRDIIQDFIKEIYFARGNNGICEVFKEQEQGDICYVRLIDITEKNLEVGARNWNLPFNKKFVQRTSFYNE
jgi:hypothetical protein